MQKDSSDDTPLDFQSLLQAAVSEALAHEDPERFMNWLREHIRDHETESSDGAWLDAPFVAVLGRSIWNALPLPGNGFKSRPLPEPGRNDPCFCGSGDKYKRCCAGTPVVSLDPDAILPVVLDSMERDSLAAHIRSARAPVWAVVELANQRFQRGELWNVVDVLEPLFVGEIRRAEDHHVQALELLCSLYVELGHGARRDELLERLVQAANPSPLRSEAWQRIAVTRLDRDDIDGAWEAFHHAQRDHPDAPGVGLLEIQLLMSRGRIDEARERAGFWEKRLRRQGRGDDDRLVGFFAGMTRDPRGVMADMGIKAAGGAGGRLRTWLAEVADRPLPPTPASLAALEHHWHEVFPPDNPWKPGLEEQWMAFLTQHPEAFDSLDILDDLSTALTRHPQYGADWLDHALIKPLLARAEQLRGRTTPTT